MPYRRTSPVLIARLLAGLVLATASACGAPHEDPETPPSLISGEVPELPVGAELSFRTDEDVSTESHRVGDIFTARLARAATVGGNVVIPEAAESRWEVTRSTKDDGSGRAVLAFRLTSVRAGGKWLPVTATTTAAALDTESGSNEETPDVVVGEAAGLVAAPFPADTPASGEVRPAGSVVTLSAMGSVVRVHSGSTVTVRLDRALTIG